MKFKNKNHLTSRTLLYAEANEQAVKTATIHASKDAVVRTGFSGGVVVEVNRGWGIHGSLYVNMTLGERDKTEDGVNFRYLHPEAELSWSSTGRSVAQALASIEVYTELTKLGALIEAVLNEKPVVNIEG